MLTPSQTAAVEFREGPLLVLAGPGSGKTRVITHRVAHLINTGVSPYQILGLTFTNKAAGEMSHRVAELVPGARVWISTFHRFCAWLLRERAETVGLRSNFTIFDDADQQALMRQVLAGLDLDSTTYSPGKLLGRIGRLKNEMITADIFAQQMEERVGDHLQAVLARVYPAYQKALLTANAVDFDDLLLHVAGLMHEHEELRAALDERFRFLLVDEYQDTNLAQYAIVRGLSRTYPNVCVTGDPDQSIYGWRGARIRNILDFERDYPSAQVIRLEENFRSTSNILFAADELITGNIHRKAKRLIGRREEGGPVRRMLFMNGQHEAQAIAAEIAEKITAGERKRDDFAIVYRVNSLSRELESALRREGLPYQVAAGVSFYDRAEVKDLIAYLRILYNPADVVAFRRIINRPKRAIGETTQRRVIAYADSQGMTPIDAARVANHIDTLGRAPRAALAKFIALYDSLLNATTGSMTTLITEIVNQSRYTEAWEADRVEEDAQRLANVEEMITAAAQYDREMKKEGSLEGFLEQISLSNEVDSVQDDAGQVTLMTLHAAKGLEFPCVYIVGLEHGLLPHERATASHDIMELEEERRLLFVGVTRAKDELTLTHAARRDVRGRSLPAIPSEFLREMTLEAVDITEGTSYARRNRPAGDLPAEWLDQSDFDPGDYGDSNDLPAELAEEDISQVTDDEEPARQIDADPGDPTHESTPAPTRSPRKKAKSPPAGLKLTTAAQLLQGSGEGVALPQGFARGDRVRHPRYGVGTVIATEGLARNRRVTVEFQDDTSPRTFLAAQAPLQPIGGP